MSEITKINVNQIQHKTATNKQDKVDSKPGKAFDQLLQTVQTLEDMGEELDAAMSESAIKNANAVKNGVDSVNSYIKSMEGIVEKFSSDRPPASKPSGYGISQYEQGSKPKKA